MEHLARAGERHDILFLGNSRVRMHVDPRVVDSITGLDSYCAALDAGRVAEFRMMLGLYLRAHPAPRLVAMNLDFTCVNLRSDVHNYPEYIPYLADPLVRDRLVPYSPKLQRPALYPWYSFSMLAAATDDEKLALLANLAGGRGAKAPGAGEASYKGFAPQARPWSPLLVARPYTAAASDDAFAVIDSIAADCRSRGIPLFVFTAPIYREFRGFVRKWREVDDRIAAAIARNGLRRIDYTGLPLCADRDKFYNYEHLNARGAEEFSRILGADVRDFIRTSSR
jgi:hypothetical protein